MAVQLSDTGAFMSVSGNTCPRGAVYARQECTAPERMITAVIPAEGSSVPLSVKTSVPVSVKLPVSAGDVIIPDVLRTGADIVATRSLP